MNLVNETILGTVISILADNVEISWHDFITSYQKLFGRYIDCSSLERILNKSIPEENWTLIQQAKSLALGNDIEESHQIYSLCSIFSNLSLDGSYPSKKYYLPSILTMENVMPCSKVNNQEHKFLIQGFYNELDLLTGSPPNDFNSFLIVIDALFMKYFWSIPVRAGRTGDISLYDYIRAAVAICAASAQNYSGNVPYLLVAGHFSGIQKYIFLVSRTGSGGVTKRLRARSFYVNAMVSALAHCIIHRFNLPMMNIMMLTGGKFYLLLPNNERAEEELFRIEDQTARFLFEKYKGNLSLELVWEAASKEELCDYSNMIVRLSKKINQKKKRPLEHILVKDNDWNMDQFIVYKDLADKSMCTSCRSALVDEGKTMCPNCETDTEVGGILPKIRSFSFSRKQGQFKLLEDYYLNLDLAAGGKKTYLILKLNDTNFSDMYDKPVSVHYAVNYVPEKCAHEVMTFSEIADKSMGSKKLGILKADVDTLGFLFSEGLRDDENNLISAARAGTLSRMLDQFFGGFLYRLIKHNYPNVYCIFSGGDDLFFVGPWNNMPDLAIDINRKFHEYTGNNPCISLSAAICMAESGGHISTLAENCEERLRQVKQHNDRQIYPDKKGRNGIFFLGQIMSWEDFERQIEKGKNFSDSIPYVGTSLLRRLANYSRMYQSYIKDGDIDKLMFLPLFSYDMKRNKDTLKKDQWLQTYFRELYRKASNYKKADTEIYYAEFSVHYAFQLTKGGRLDGGQGR